jgi:osmotically-inducible protein OsmY
VEANDKAVAPVLAFVPEKIRSETHVYRMRTYLLVLAALLFSFNGTGATAPHNNGVRLSDAEIEAKIKTKLAKSKIGKDGMTVHVKNGIATWQGTTNVMQHKGAATRMARTAGAIQVVNNIKLTDEARANFGAVKKVEVKKN